MLLQWSSHTLRIAGAVDHRSSQLGGWIAISNTPGCTVFIEWLLHERKEKLQYPKRPCYDGGRKESLYHHVEPEQEAGEKATLKSHWRGTDIVALISTGETCARTLGFSGLLVLTPIGESQPLQPSAFIGRSKPHSNPIVLAMLQMWSQTGPGRPGCRCGAGAFAFGCGAG